MFSWFDFVVFGLFLGLSIFVGVYHALRARFTKFAHSGTDEYLTGGHNLPVFPVCLSLLTTFISGIALLGVPAEIYLRGASMGAAHLLGAFAFVFTGIFFIPMFYKLRSTNVYEYFELRFDSEFLRAIGTGMFILNTSVYMAIVIYAPSIALSGAADLPLWPFIIGVGVAGTFYTAIGGIKAVVWADTLQAFFLVIGLGTLLIKGTIDAGGMRNVFASAEASGRLSDAIFRFDPSPFQYNNFWVSTVGGMVHAIGMFGLNQMALQRYLGLLIFAFFHGCDPVALGEVSTPDQLSIILAAQVLGAFPGMLGLFLSCLFSATLSTISSGMNSMVAVIYEDVLKSRIPNERHAPLVMKLVVVLLGVLATGMAFLCQLLGGIFQVVIATLGATSGPIAGCFFLGIFFPRANKHGAIVGFFFSSVFMVLVSILYNLDKPFEPYVLNMQAADTPAPTCMAANQTQMSALIGDFYAHKTPDNHYGAPGSMLLSRLSPFAYSFTGIFLTVAIGLLVSWAWPQPMNEHKKTIAFACTHQGLKCPLPKLPTSHESASSTTTASDEKRKKLLS
ncbi:Sodium/solute symporter family and Sodium/solute symporter, subgroup family-containing protein [Aphelenchoides fujianensis]|nr:Sodium/solute symporter family and Sodium/solute symporter, subgroup family-containing protein [Aphelenchoides fujianensis]